MLTKKIIKNILGYKYNNKHFYFSLELQALVNPFLIYKTTILQQLTPSMSNNVFSFSKSEVFKSSYWIQNNSSNFLVLKYNGDKISLSCGTSAVS